MDAGTTIARKEKNGKRNLPLRRQSCGSFLLQEKIENGPVKTLLLFIQRVSPLGIHHQRCMGNGGRDAAGSLCTEREILFSALKVLIQMCK